MIQVSVSAQFYNSVTGSASWMQCHRQAVDTHNGEDSQHDDCISMAQPVVDVVVPAQSKLADLGYGLQEAGHTTS